MENEPASLIDALGGTTAVARLTHAPVSTVHSWRKNGIPASRLAHLRLIWRDFDNADELDAIAARVAPEGLAA